MADDNEELRTVMEPYSFEENHYKKSRKRIMDSMKKSLGQTGKADFNHKTYDVLKHHVCLRVIGNRRKLRDHPRLEMRFSGTRAERLWTKRWTWLTY